MKKGIVALLVVAAIPFFVTSFASAYISPGKPTGYVNDFAQILEPAERTELNSFLTDFKQQTGAEIAVVTVPTLGDETVESYAVKLFEEWGIGEKGKDNGVLLLVAMQEKKIRIEVGYGLEGDLTDAQSSTIIRNIMQPAFREGNYSGGILQAVHAITEIIKKNPEYVLPQDQPKVKFNGDWIFYLIFIPIYLSSILARSKSWWAGGVIGGIAGIIIGFVFGFVFTGIIATIGLIILGLIFDYFISKAYHSNVSRGMNPPWWTGGRGGGGIGGGGFGGFGGGRSGGGGASGGW